MPSGLSKTELEETFSAFRRQLTTGGADEIASYLSDLARVAATALRTDGSFRHFSYNNRFLLDCQRKRFKELHVGLYAGVAQFKRLGRVVKPDAKPKKIWAAMGGGARDEDDAVQTPDAAGADQGERRAARMAARATLAATAVEPAPEENAQPARRGFGGFRLVSVYDWSDTTAIDPDSIEPDWEKPLVSGTRAAFDALVAVSPVPVRVERLGGSLAKARLDASGIVVDEDLPVGNRIVALARQLAHERLGTLAEFGATDSDPNSSPARADREAEASLIAALVARMMDVDATEAISSSAAWLCAFVDPETRIELAGIKKKLKLLGKRLDAALEVAEAIVKDAVAPASALVTAAA